MQPLAYELNRDEPRLSGKLTYGLPIWQLDLGDGWIKVITDEKHMRGTIRFFIFLAIAIVPGVVFLGHKYLALGYGQWSLWISALGMALVQILAACILQACVVHARRAGPWFRYSRTDGVFEFPRSDYSVTREQVVSWDLIAGVWVRGEAGAAESRFPDEISELHLVFRDQNTLKSLPVIGALGLHGLDAVAAKIASTSGTALRRIDMGRRLRTQRQFDESLERGRE